MAENGFGQLLIGRRIRRKEKQGSDAMDNPYLDEFYRIKRNDSERFTSRIRMIAKYCFAVPSENALEAIKSLEKPIIEIGAGSGYWAYLLNNRGVDIICFDDFSGKYGIDGKRWKETWFEVKKGSIEKIKEHPDRVLFLCWPDCDKSMASDCLKVYSGDIVIYIGEGKYGCTADNLFFDLIDRDYGKEEYIGIPQWDGIHDGLSIFRRN